MAEQTDIFFEFLDTVDERYRGLVSELHELFLANGCKAKIDQAKNGYRVSYAFKADGKSVCNFVFRKKGMIVRIYANGLKAYESILADLPANMVKEIVKAPICKRLVNPDDCSPTCIKGNEFTLDGTFYQKCRYNAFMFLLNDESYPHIKKIAQEELKTRA